jgi:hypothetical protein
MNLKGIMFEIVEGVQLPHDRDQWWDLVKKVNEPSGSIKGVEYFDYLSDHLPA